MHCSINYIFPTFKSFSHSKKNEGEFLFEPHLLQHREKTLEINRKTLNPMENLMNPGGKFFATMERTSSLETPCPDE